MICQDPICRGNRPCDTCDKQMMGAIVHALRASFMNRTQADIFFRGYHYARKGIRVMQDQLVTLASQPPATETFEALSDEAKIALEVAERTEEVDSPEAAAAEAIVEALPNTDIVEASPPEPLNGTRKRKRDVVESAS